ncbi:MAG: pyridoxal phosphate-dependent aminotransferase [Candidatus Marinimicrobia bacterium]|jgi:aspartate aminotransferase|nr:pyridoxal phosphate-dependent aminotransferase [Candidatus Neomarinimicrobiota bacterium]
MLTERIGRITPSATLAMTAKAAELRAVGKPVINLSVGEPDFPTPKNIRLAGQRAIEEGHTRYTPGGGTMELKKAVVEKLSRDNNLHYDTSQILISCGGKHSLYNACQALFQTGDEVIIFSPYWVSFPDFVSVTGAKPVFVNTNPLHQFEPVLDDLKAKITPRTKGIIINSPSNPTGGVWSDEAVLKVLEIAQDANAWIFSDECYEQLTYDRPYISTAVLGENAEKVLTFQSCSKTYAMTGWRIGYTAGDEKVIQAMGKLQGQSTSCPCSIAQVAATEALIGDQSEVAIMRNVFKKRRDYIVNRLNKMNGVHCDNPGGAFYVFPDFSTLMGSNKKIQSSNDLSMYLLEQKAVVTVAGKAFGSDGNVRFSYAASDEDLSRAMDLLEETLTELE